jgi:glutaminase
MTPSAIPDQVEQRLRELHDRHRDVASDRIAGHYVSGRGLQPIDPDASDPFAIAVTTVDGRSYKVGDCAEPFALQSISKVFAYALALEEHGRDYVLDRVGVEPSGDAFNSIVIDARNRRPFNPMVNAGALVVCDMIGGDDHDEQLRRSLAAFRGYAANPALDVDADMLATELAGADRNRAILYLMRSQGMVRGEVEATLRLYLEQCSVGVNAADLATMGATLANGGANPVSGDRVLCRERVRDVLSVMFTCGMYDYAGEWAFDVGLPAKSGVSGGIVCVIPGKMGVAVLSPGLDVYGNSVRGIDVCREISERLGAHVFAGDDEDALTGTSAPADAVV